MNKASLTTNRKQILYHLIVFVIAATMTDYGSCQVDKSKALIWSQTGTDGEGVLRLLFGDPKIYVPQLLQNKGQNVSFKMGNMTWSENRFHALDAYYANSTVYYSANDFICYSTDLLSNVSHWDLPFAAISTEVTGLSYDWLSRLLYWSDAGYQRICLTMTFPSYRWRIVVDTNLTSPQDVSVYPQKSYLFWSDVGVNPKIERLDLKNDERKIIVSASTLSQPKSLCIDFVNQRLYWLDIGTSALGSVNLDGSGLTLWSEPSLFTTISSFVIYENYIFLGNKDKSVVLIYDFSRQHYLANITSLDGSGIFDMTMWSPERQPNVSSPCNVANGGCHHICITLNPTSRRCLCGMGFQLHIDGSTCLTKVSKSKKILLVTDEDQTNTFQIDVDNGEVGATQSHLFYVTAMDFDPISRYFYCFESYRKFILVTSLATNFTQGLLNITGTEVASLAYDRVTDTLIYVDYFNANIGQIGSKTTKILLKQPGSKPRAVCLDSSSRLMYWTDCGRMTIERGMITDPNRSRSSVVTGLRSCATAITIDIQGKSLYWGDSQGSIETVKLDGTRRIMIHNDMNANYTGLALDSTYLYIADSNKRQIQRLNKITRQVTNLTKMVFMKPYAIVFYTIEEGTNTQASDSNSKSKGTNTYAYNPDWNSKGRDTYALDPKVFSKIAEAYDPKWRSKEIDTRASYSKTKATNAVIAPVAIVVIIGGICGACVKKKRSS